MRKIKQCLDRKVITRPNKVVVIHTCTLPKRHGVKHTDGNITW